MVLRVFRARGCDFSRHNETVNNANIGDYNVFYRIEISLDAKLENETIWLTQDMMAKLFETTPQNITMHIKNIYEDEELEQNSTCKDFLQVRNEGKRTVSRKLTHYNLDMILSVG